MQSSFTISRFPHDSSKSNRCMFFFFPWGQSMSWKPGNHDSRPFWSPLRAFSSDVVHVWDSGSGLARECRHLRAKGAHTSFLSTAYGGISLESFSSAYWTIRLWERNVDSVPFAIFKCEETRPRSPGGPAGKIETGIKYLDPAVWTRCLLSTSSSLKFIFALKFFNLKLTLGKLLVVYLTPMQ